jgi:hypothetical protein
MIQWGGVNLLDSRISFSIVCVSVGVLMILLWSMGGLAGKIAPDTASYFVTVDSSNPWGEMRHPLYGAVATWLGATSTTPGRVALVQSILHVVAALAIYVGASFAGSSRAGALCICLAALFSQSGLFHLRLLVPESAAVSFLLLAFAGILAASRSLTAFWVLLVPIGIATGIAYILRPTFLPAMVVIPALWLVLALRNEQTRRASRTILLFCAVGLPFVIQSGIRWRAVGDFNIVSFGGYQMSAMTGFMLTPEVVDSLPDGVRPTASAILNARNTAELAGKVMRTPLNSVGERSFVSAAIGYFDIYARTYDDFLSEGISNVRKPGESWVEFNNRLQQFSIATIIAVPVPWVAWVGGATSRLVGRMLMTNATVLVAIGMLLVAAVPAFVRRTGLGSSVADLPVISAVALAWLAATGPLIVLVTFPATRYIDSAAILIAAVPALVALALVQGLWGLCKREGRSDAALGAQGEETAARQGNGAPIAFHRIRGEKVGPVSL